jgi:hypothetical protein
MKKVNGPPTQISVDESDDVVTFTIAPSSGRNRVSAITRQVKEVENFETVHDSVKTVKTCVVHGVPLL